MNPEETQKYRIRKTSLDHNSYMYTIERRIEYKKYILFGPLVSEWVEYLEYDPDVFGDDKYTELTFTNLATAKKKLNELISKERFPEYIYAE